MFNFFNKLFENYLKSFAPDMLRNLKHRRYPEKRLEMISVSLKYPLNIRYIFV